MAKAAPQAPQAPQENPQDLIRKAYMQSLTQAPSEPTKRGTVGGVAENVQTAVDKFQKGDIGAGIGAGIGGVADFLNSSVGQNIMAGVGGDLYEKQAHLKGAGIQEGKDAAAQQAYALAKQKQADLQKDFITAKDKEAFEAGQNALDRGVQFRGQNIQQNQIMLDDINKRIENEKDPVKRDQLRSILMSGKGVDKVGKFRIPFTQVRLGTKQYVAKENPAGTPSFAQQ